MEDTPTTPPPRASESPAADADLAMESPPALLMQSPYVAQDGFGQLSTSTKRTRAEIATPRKPGTDEARAQLAMEYIATPARAPPAMKRPMRSGSPVSRRPVVSGTGGLLGSRSVLMDSNGLSLVERTKAALLSSGRDTGVPRFSLLPTDMVDMAVDQPEPTSDEDVFGSPVAAAPHAQQAALLSSDRDLGVPRFSLSPTDMADMAIDRPEPTSDEDVFGSPIALAPRAQPAVSPVSEAKLGVESLSLTGARPDTPPVADTMAGDMSEDDRGAAACTAGEAEAAAALHDSPATQPEHPEHPTVMAVDKELPASPDAMALDSLEPAEFAAEAAAVVVNTVSPEVVLEAALKAVEPHAEVLPATTLPH
ncbi:hypothetical protein H4R19_001068, partial [Coemansia spiralis]